MIQSLLPSSSVLDDLRQTLELDRLTQKHIKPTAKSLRLRGFRLQRSNSDNLSRIHLVLALVRTDALDCFIPVHDRHVDVHEDDSRNIRRGFARGRRLERFPVGCLERIECDFAVQSRKVAVFVLLRECYEQLQIDSVVVYEK